MKAHGKNNDLNPSLESTASRTQLAMMIMQLFELWDLDTGAQLNLLGLSETSRAMLSKFKKGESPLSNHRDSLDRVGWLLAIHKSLRLLYPQNPELRYDWVNRKNKALNNEAPIEIMIREGILGLAKISRYLDFLCSR
jgi:hypothetical protein